MAIEERAGSPVAAWAARTAGLALGAGGWACALTVLSRSSRAVLDMGGTCATGVARDAGVTCPDGLTGLVLGAVVGGIVAAVVYAVASVPGGPCLLGLLWPSLFLTLAWNFFDYGVEPPGGDGVVWGWVACGVLSAALGAAPLVTRLTPRRARAMLWGGDGPAGWRSEVPTAPFRPATGEVPRVLGWFGPEPEQRLSRASTNGAGADTGVDVVSRLERLSALRRDGILSEAEFEAAKREVLEGR